MPDDQSFYLIVADLDRGVFSVKGPMTGSGKLPRKRPATISGTSSARPANPDREKPIADYRHSANPRLAAAKCARSCRVQQAVAETRYCPVPSYVQPSHENAAIRQPK